MAVVLGLAVALSYGAADFLGGLASRRAPTAAVVVVSQLLGLGVLAGLALVADFGEPTTRDLLLGAGAGAVGGVGIALLYQGLATGRMSVVAPITAVGAAVVPVTWGLATGERPSALSLTGVALALVAVALVSRTADLHAATELPRRPVLMLAVGAGLAFGAVFILLGETGEGSGFWPLAAGRTTSITCLTLGAAVTGRSLRPPRSSLPMVGGAGVLDITANALYLLAVRRGLLSLVAVVSSLYPAATVGLARIVLQERFTRVQLVGLGLAGLGVVLIAA